MAAEMDVAIRDHIHADLRHGLETMIRFLESLAKDDQELLPIQMSNSWCNLDRVSTQLHTIQVSKERMQQVSAVYLKWATDESVVIKKEIATLDGFVSIATDEQTEIEVQDEYAQQLLETYSKHLKEAEEQLRKKTSQNWRIAKVFTNALANSEAEARRAFRQMADFTSGHTSRYKSTMDRRQESVEAISKARSKHENLVNNELCEKLEEINQLNICFKSGKNQSEELATVSAILDPITIYCHVLCEVCQQLPVDPMIIQPILDELDSSLKRCFSQEVEGLYTLQKERENLQLLAAGVASLSSSQMVLSLSFDDDTFSQLEFPMTSSANRCLSEETGGVSVSFLVGEDDSDDDDQTIPMQIASGSAAAVSCDVTDYSSRDLCSAMSHDLTSSDCESRGTLVAPEAERMESIKMSIKNMETISSGDDTDFSLSEFPPKDGFDYLEWPSSFQASINQLQSAWWACLVATRNSFLMFQLYTRIIAVCLIQADQTLQMGRNEDLSLYLHKTLPVLEKSSQTIRKIAEQLEDNFCTLTGIVAELTETCTVASSNASTSQRQLSATEQVNLKEKEITAEELKKMIQQRKALAASIERAEEEFAKVVLELPGVFNLLGTTAADKCSSALHFASKYFRKLSEKAMSFQIVGFIKTVGKTLIGIKENVGEFLTYDDVDTGDEATEYEDPRTGNDEEVSRELITHIKVMQIKTAVDLMTQMLLEQDSLQVQRSNDTIWETQAQLEASMRAVKKTTGKFSELERIVSSLLNVCQTVLSESKSINPSKEAYEQVISILSEAQDSLETMSKTLKEKLDARTAERNAAAAEDASKPTKDRRYPILEEIAQKRFAKGKELHTLWKRYDRQTDHITSHFEVQKETAELLSRLTVELNVLEKTLDLMSKASTDLTNLQNNVQTISGFAQQVSNVIQITLCPRLDKFTLEMRHCQETVQKSERGSVSNLQQETLQKEIRDAGLTAKQMYQCSKDFVARGYHES